MYKNQLQELAQRSCFNLPSYTCIREGPDHAPRFKSTVNFNGEIFESPTFCTTLRQAEHSAAEVALSTLATRGPSRTLAARVLDETGAYKNLLQETVHRAGLNLPVYTTVRSGPGHVPVFTSKVELAGMSFTGEPAKTKKQAQKNAAMAAWSALKQMSNSGSSSSSSSSSPSLESEGNDEQEYVTVARVLARLCPPETNKSSTQNDRHRGRRRSAPVRRNMNPASVGLSMYPIQYPGWPYSNFSPEVAMYQMWQQEQASQQQRGLLTLPVVPAPPPAPQIVPFIIQPDHMPYFPANVQEPIRVVPGIAVSASRPSICFSNHSMPLQICRPLVTIQEIQEERVIHGDANPDSRKVNTQSNPSVFSPFEVQNPSIPGINLAEPLIQTRPQGIQQKKGGSESSIRNSVQQEGNSWRFRDTAVGPRSRSPGPVEFRLGSPRCLDSSVSNLRPDLLPTESSLEGPKCYQPPLLPAPVMVRTVGPVSSVTVRPRPENLKPQVPAPVTIRNSAPACSARTRPMKFGGIPSVNFMAPAVQIRSVVPVCSAPPARKLPVGSQEERFSSGESRTKESTEVAGTIQDLGKLQI
ncbi:Double-stranded RNA-binding domain [Macleaya cordata]|uniref:Double-stranded RNA-binding domain n=1 Tax=Macleaya cordata TaxID=56857 RepID=A0A200QX39_MACCD|nr:Double-stranded RNA-binding domain [Macleaya cordata]